MNDVVREPLTDENGQEQLDNLLLIRCSDIALQMNLKILYA
jgi:hypothetical protein